MNKESESESGRRLILTFIASQATAGVSEKPVAAGAVVQTGLTGTFISRQLTPVPSEAHSAASAVKSFRVRGVVYAYGVDTRAALAAHVTHAANLALEHCRRRLNSK